MPGSARLGPLLAERQVGEPAQVVGQVLLLDRDLLPADHEDVAEAVGLLGGAGGRLQGGRVLNYSERPNRKMCSLYLSMLDKCGVHLKEFGDSTERLSEI